MRRDRNPRARESVERKNSGDGKFRGSWGRAAMGLGVVWAVLREGFSATGCLGGLLHKMCMVPSRQSEVEVRSVRVEAVEKTMKKPMREERQRMCTGKRRYRSQGDALEAVARLGLERQRSAYVCAICRLWHLTSR